MPRSVGSPLALTFRAAADGTGGVRVGPRGNDETGRSDPCDQECMLLTNSFPGHHGSKFLTLLRGRLARTGQSWAPNDRKAPNWSWRRAADLTDARLRPNIRIQVAGAQDRDFAPSSRARPMKALSAAGGLRRPG